MSRRFFVLALAMAVSILPIGSCRSSNKVDVGPIRYQYPSIGPPWPKPVHPTWLGKGTVFVGNWEPLAWNYRKNWQNWGNARSGAGAAALDANDRTEETAAKLQAMGITMVLSGFHKGLGIINERDTMEQARRYGATLRKHGIRLGVLVSTLLMYEDLYGEIPESKTWHRVQYNGTPDTYGNDGYRYRAYLNHPAYIDYMKKVCEMAIDRGIEAIFFDTVRQTGENHHPLAQQMFREWLKAKYPNQNDWFFRTGLHHRDFIKIPHLAEGWAGFPDTALSETYDQAIMQEYLDFKTQQITDFAAEMKSFIQKKNPQVALWFNTGGITGANVIDSFNMDHARLLPWLDMYYSEEQDYAAYNAQGGIVSKIRTIKAGQRMGDVHTNATGQPPPQPERSLDPPRDDPRLRLAEAMAFNRLSVGNVGYGALNTIDNLPEGGRRYIRFYRDNFDNLLSDCETAADVAVLRTFTSMAFSNFATHEETVLAEQALIQSQMPFDMIFDRELDNLSKYKVVVLGDQESLSDAQVNMLKNYVGNGGALVVTSDTSMYDQWRRQRDVFGLSEVLGLQRPPKAGNHELVQHEFGKGRAVYIPHLISAVAVPPRTQFTFPYYAPPVNTAEFMKAVRWAGGDKLNWHIEAPQSVAAEVYYQHGTGRYIVHLVNYNCWKQPNINGVQVRMHLKDGERFHKATMYSPDDGGPVELRLVSANNGSSFSVPHLGIYSIVVIDK